MPYVLEDAPSGRFVLEDGPPAAVSAGGALNDIPRQIGLTARYGLEGMANTAQIFTEPIRNAFQGLRNSAPMLGDSGVQSPLMMERKPTAPTRPLGQVATSAADAIGLPLPQGANERVIGDATRLVAGAGGLGGAARVVAGSPGAVGAAGEFLSANMPQQLASAAGAGLAGGASREAGGSPLMQGGAALVGGVAGGMVPGAAGSVINVARRLMPTPSPQQLDVQINAIMERAGVDYSQIPERARQSLRQDLAQAMRTGQELDPAAVSRLADFRLTGLTPTRGAITQDPVQITREMNLAKTGANSADDELQGLARVQNQNNARLIQNMNDAGARDGDPFRAGQVGIGSILAEDAARQRGVNALYEAARQMPGGTIPLERKSLVDNIYGALAKENKMAFLPESVDNYLRQFSAGVVNVGGKQHPVPFDANALDNLLTTIATAQRGSNDGNVKAALGIVRRAIDSSPIQPVKNTFGGNQIVTGHGAQFLRDQDAQAGQFMDALNKARSAARDRFNFQESARPIEAAIGGAQPDNFFQRFVVDGTLDDARALSQLAPREVMRNAILAHVKEKAVGGAADDVGKVSQSAFNKALNAIGDRKLSLFFTPEELASLRANARVASYVQVQPVGSAVNNSNSGALLLGKGLDALVGLSNAAPVIGPLVAQPITNGIRGLNVAVQTQHAQNVAPGLLATSPRVPIGQGLLLPGMAAGGTAAGLLAAP